MNNKDIDKKSENNNTKKSPTKKVILLLIFAFIISLIISNVFFSVFRIFSDSMSPNLKPSDYVIAIDSKNISQGDIIAFQKENKTFIKRVIGKSGDIVDIDKNGNVFINDKFINEPYVAVKSFDKVNIDFPYKVQDKELFVLGDNRDTSIDSRVSELGTVSKDEIIGKIVFRVYPLAEIGIVD